jgi:hypothetical protein
VQITSYNSHLGLLRSELCRVNTAQSTRVVASPGLVKTSIRNWRGWLFLRTDRQLEEHLRRLGANKYLRDFGPLAALVDAHY